MVREVLRLARERPAVEADDPRPGVQELREGTSRLPEIPVTRTVRGMPGNVMGSVRSAKAAPTRNTCLLGEAALEQRRHRRLDLLHLALELGVVLVGRAGEPERLAEVEVIARRERGG